MQLQVLVFVNVHYRETRILYYLKYEILLCKISPYCLDSCASCNFWLCLVVPNLTVLYCSIQTALLIPWGAILFELSVYKRRKQNTQHHTNGMLFKADRYGIFGAKAKLGSKKILISDKSRKIQYIIFWMWLSNMCDRYVMEAGYNKLYSKCQHTKQ